MNQKTNIRSLMDLYMVVLVLIITVIDLSSSVQNLIATPLIQSFFSHPGFGSTDYPLGNYTEDWYITTNWVNHTIKINIKACTIEAPKGVCINDYLYIYDGANETSNELMKSCCGTHHPGNSWESTNEEMYLLFVTDDTISAAGFEIEYWSNGITTTTSTTTEAPTTDNMLYIIIGCVVAGLLLLILILVIVICLKKNRPVGPKPFLVHDQEPNNAKSAKLKNEKGPIVMIRPPPTPPLHTIMPHAETNIFDLELPEKARGNLLPPLYSSSVNHTQPTDNK